MLFTTSLTENQIVEVLNEKFGKKEVHSMLADFFSKANNTADVQLLFKAYLTEGMFFICLKLNLFILPFFPPSLQSKIFKFLENTKLIDTIVSKREKSEYVDYVHNFIQYVTAICDNQEFIQAAIYYSNAPTFTEEKS
jgi:hypothetical protein